MDQVTGRPHRTIGGVGIWKVGCLGFIVVVGLAFVAFNELAGTSSGDVIIDGIECGGMVNNGYHVHAHLSLFNKNRPVGIPVGIGLSQYGCYYWLHNHTPDGVIHIEGRNKITPTLGTWFDIWGKPLSRSKVWFVTVKPGQTMRVYVDRQVYTGNPRAILLQRHTDVAIEVGPPFMKPPVFRFPHGL
jgi:hypothetical protein